MGNVDVAMLLLEHGADMAGVDYVSGTPLPRASDKGHLNIVEFLLEHDVKVDARGMRGITPLNMASSNGDLNVARVLLRHGGRQNYHRENTYPLVGNHPQEHELCKSSTNQCLHLIRFLVPKNL